MSEINRRCIRRWHAQAKILGAQSMAITGCRFCSYPKQAEDSAVKLCTHPYAPDDPFVPVSEEEYPWEVREDLPEWCPLREHPLLLVPEPAD